jgi:DNA polymerase elongation subunit (family B)
VNNLKTLPFEEIKKLIKTKELSYFNFYNNDLPLAVHYSSNYYLSHDYDTIEKDQILNTLFYDIEVYVKEGEISATKDQINAITTCTTKDKTYKAFYLLCNVNYKKFGIDDGENFNFEQLISNHEIKLRTDLINGKYIDDSFKIELMVFNDERELLIAFCKELHESDAHFLSGWNTSLFDLPYIYNRMVALFGKSDTDRMLSKFGVVTVLGNMVSITEFITADLLYLYKPRSEGGLNLGSTRNNYTLDNVAFLELGLKKIEYKGEEVDLNSLYENDPYNFLLYNIVDVVLCYKLNEKLKHIELYNLIRRIMRTPMSSSLIGSSALFDTFTYSKLTENKQYVRYGINNEMSQNVNEKIVDSFPPFKDKKGIIQKPAKLSTREYSNVVSKFPGAFVNIPIGQIINDGSLVIDLDAASLYPSMIKQFNISFDTYIGRILPPCTYKTLQLLETCLGKQNYPDQLPMQIEKLCWDYVDAKGVAQKKQTANKVYNIILYLFDNLIKSGLQIEHIYQPVNVDGSLLLKTQLIPLMDLINMIHPENPTYNQFAYDFMFTEKEEDLEEKYSKIYIIENPGDSNTSMRTYGLQDTRNIIQKFIITLSGCLFFKHETKTGMFIDFLNNTGNMRKEYKNLRDTSSEGSYEYNLNNARQKSVKVIMNTLYGLFGMSSFRYSNHWLAQSITNSGMMTNKIAQYLGEQYLEFSFGK